jgi:transposase
MTKSYSVGIDIASKELVLSAIEKPGQPELISLKVENSISGMKLMLKELRKAKISPADCWFCFEHTGNYGLLLSCFLQQNNITFTSVAALEIKQSQGVKREKTDAADAHSIAVYAAVNRHKLKPSKLLEESLLTIKELLSYRDQVVRIRTQLKNSHKSRKFVKGLIDNAWILADIKKQITSLDSKVEKIEEALRLQIAKNKDLQMNFTLAKSVKGVGTIIAAFLLVHTNNFTAFNNSRQFNSYAGVAPFKHESGSSIRGKTRVSNYSNKQMKTLLYNAANSAVVHDPELRSYYKRKREENKPHLSVINAVAAKIIGRTFAVVKRGTPYVNTYAQKI